MIENDKHVNPLRELQKELTAANKRIAELEAALKPFAAVVKTHPIPKKPFVAVSVVLWKDDVVRAAKVLEATE